LGWSHFKRPVNLANALTLLVAPTGSNGGDLVKTAIPETAHPECWIQWRPRWWPAGSKKHAELVQILAVSKQSSDMYISIGNLVDYEFARTRQLDRPVLSETSRRLPSKDKRSLANSLKEGDHDDRFYPSESRNFIIRYSNICIVNFIYLFLQETESQPAPPTGCS
jgi:hypothetical protein